MWISDIEKDILIDKSKFLLDKCYELEVDDYDITLSKDGIQIVAGFPPMSDVSEVGIRFIKKNDYYNISWIAVVRHNLLVNCKDKLNGAIQLLKYTEENYEKIINYEYCAESRKLVSEYIEKLKKA